jgi:hypothetical protein
METSANPIPTCPYCGFLHKALCSKIRAIEYFEDGTVKRVEFHSPAPLVGPPQPWTTTAPQWPPSIAPQVGPNTWGGVCSVADPNILMRN